VEVEISNGTGSISKATIIPRQAFWVSAWIVSSALCVIMGMIGGRVWQRSIDQRLALGSLAKRLGVENDLQVIRSKVHCELITLGEAKSSVEQALKQVGDYEEYDSWNGAVSIYFDDYFTVQVVSIPVLRFENGILVDKRYQVTSDTTIQIECP